MAKTFPIHPAHPERICWGCDTYCAADAMRCGNGSDRTQHPLEIFGTEWNGWDEEPSQSHNTSPASSTNCKE